MYEIKKPLARKSCRLQCNDCMFYLFKSKFYDAPLSAQLSKKNEHLSSLPSEKKNMNHKIKSYKKVQSFLSKKKKVLLPLIHTEKCFLKAVDSRQTDNSKK